MKMVKMLGVFLLTIALVGIFVLAIILGSEDGKANAAASLTTPPQQGDLLAFSEVDLTKKEDQNPASVVKANPAKELPSENKPAETASNPPVELLDDQDTGEYSTGNATKTAPEAPKKAPGDGPPLVEKTADATKQSQHAETNNCTDPAFLNKLTPEDKEAVEKGTLTDCMQFDENTKNPQQKMFVEASKVPELEKEIGKLKKDITKLTEQKKVAEAATKIAKDEAKKDLTEAKEAAKKAAVVAKATADQKIKQAEKKIAELEQEVKLLSNKAPQKICYETTLVWRQTTLATGQPFRYQAKQKTEVSCDKKPTPTTTPLPLPPGAPIPSAPNK